MSTRNRKRKRNENYYSEDSLNSSPNVLDQNFYLIILGLKKDIETLSNKNQEIMEELDCQNTKNKILESKLKKIETLSIQNKEILKELDCQNSKNKMLESKLKKIEKTIFKKMKILVKILSLQLSTSTMKLEI